MTGPYKVFDHIETIDGTEETQKMVDCIRSVENNLELLSDGLKERFHKLVVAQIGSLQSKYTNPRNYDDKANMHVPRGMQTSINDTRSVHDYSLDNEKKIKIELARFFPKQDPSPTKKHGIIKVTKNPSAGTPDSSMASKQRNNKPSMRRIVTRKDDRFDKYSLSSTRTSSPGSHSTDQVMLNNLSPSKPETRERRSLSPRSPMQSPVNEKLGAMVREMRVFREKHSPRSPRSSSLSPGYTRDTTHHREQDKTQWASPLNNKARYSTCPVKKERLGAYNPSDYSVKSSHNSPVSRKVVSFHPQQETHIRHLRKISNQRPVNMYSKPNITFESPSKKGMPLKRRSPAQSDAVYTGQSNSPTNRDTRSGSFYPIYLDMSNKRSPGIESMMRTRHMNKISPRQFTQVSDRLSSNLESMIERQRERYKSLHERLRNNALPQGTKDSDGTPKTSSPRYGAGISDFRPDSPPAIMFSKARSPVSPSRTYSVTSSTEGHPGQAPSLSPYRDISRPRSPTSSSGRPRPHRFDRSWGTKQSPPIVNQAAPNLSAYSPHPISQQMRKYKGPPKILANSPTESFDVSYSNSELELPGILKSPATPVHFYRQGTSGMRDSGYTSGVMSQNIAPSPPTHNIGPPLSTSSPKICRDCQANCQSPFSERQGQNSPVHVNTGVSRKIESACSQSNPGNTNRAYQDSTSSCPVSVSCQTDVNGEDDQLSRCTVTTTVTVNGRVCAVNHQTPEVAAYVIPVHDVATSPLQISEHASPVQTPMCSSGVSPQQRSPASCAPQNDPSYQAHSVLTPRQCSPACGVAQDWGASKHGSNTTTPRQCSPACDVSQECGASKQGSNVPSSRQCSPTCIVGRQSSIQTEINRPPSPLPTTITQTPFAHSVLTLASFNDENTGETGLSTPRCKATASPQSCTYAVPVSRCHDFTEDQDNYSMESIGASNISCMANLRTLICQVKVATRKFVVEGVNNIPLWQVLYNKASMLKSHVSSVLETHTDDSEITDVLYGTRLEETLCRKLDDLMVADRRNSRLLEVIYGDVVSQIDQLKTCAFDRGRQCHDAILLADILTSATQLKLVSEYFLNKGPGSMHQNIINPCCSPQVTPDVNVSCASCRSLIHTCKGNLQDLTPISAQTRTENTPTCTNCSTCTETKTSALLFLRNLRGNKCLRLVLAVLLLAGLLALLYHTSGSIRDVIISFCLYIWCNLRLIHTHGGPVV